MDRGMKIICGIFGVFIVGLVVVAIIHNTVGFGKTVSLDHLITGDSLVLEYNYQRELNHVEMNDSETIDELFEGLRTNKRNLVTTSVPQPLWNDSISFDVVYDDYESIDPIVYATTDDLPDPYAFRNLTADFEQGYLHRIELYQNGDVTLLILPCDTPEEYYMDDMYYITSSVNSDVYDKLNATITSEIRESSVAPEIDEDGFANIIYDKSEIEEATDVNLTFSDEYVYGRFYIDRLMVNFSAEIDHVDGDNTFYIGTANETFIIFLDVIDDEFYGYTIDSETLEHYTFYGTVNEE